MTPLRLAPGRRASSRRLVALVGAQLRAAPFVALAGASAAALAAVLLLATAPGAPRTVSSVQFAAVALASATSVLLHDPAAVITAASPTPLWLRRAAILAVALPAAALAWLALLELAGIGGEWRATLSLELAAVAAVGLAAGARRPLLAPAVVAAAFTAAGVLCQDWVMPADGDHARTRAAAAALTLAALAAYARSSRDPLRR
jgi:hypothetical protein